MKINIEDILLDPNKLNDIFYNAIEDENKILADTLVKYIKDPWLIFKYAKKIVGDKVSNELEDIITQDPQISYYYALYILKEPFLKGENTIAQDPSFSY
ncbi:MAG: hypothetical protein NC820_08165, partial [Candidatus Omnitrophica bacterium]|nr:hypothetical protein [Candidatus Omnitrophota bacterium]